MIFLGLGSNLGDRRANIAQALGELSLRGVSITRTAPLLETPPWGPQDQGPFLNTVSEVAFSGSPEALLKVVLEVEVALGRVREYKWGPRLIDIDIIEFNRQNIDQDGLQIPHPWYTQRYFVLKPLADLEPDWVPTGESLTVSELLARL